MNTFNFVRTALAAALLLSMLGGIAGAHWSWTTSSQGGQYYVVVGSNVSGESTLPFQVTINGQDTSGKYYDSLVLEIPHGNQVVNQTIVQSTGSVTSVTLAYTFTHVGTYYLYSSIADNQTILGHINTSVDTVTALQGLIAKMTPQSPTSTQGQSDSLNVNLTDNFLVLPNNGEPSPQRYMFHVVQKAPNGATSTIAVNTSGHSGIAYGQPYLGGYTIPVPALTQPGTYTYTIYAASAAAGTNTTATASITVLAASTTTSPTTTTTTGSTSTVSTTAPTTTTPGGDPLFNFTSVSSDSYNVILGSNIIGASTLPFQVTVSNGRVTDNDADDAYTAKLVLVGSPNQVVNQATGDQVGTTANLTTSYTFSKVGTYQFYISVTNGKGVTVNTSLDTVHALQGLAATAKLSNTAPIEGQSDSLLVNATDNYGLLPNSGEGSVYYMDYKVVQTAPNGTVSSVAFNTPSNPNGQGYFGGYDIVLPPFGQSGTYSYKVYLNEWIGGLNATATTSVFVSSMSVTANTLSLSIPNSNIFVGQNEIVTAVPGGPGTPTSYAWTINGNTIPQIGNTITFNGNLSTLGADQLAATANYPSGQTITAQGTITVSAPPINTTTTIAPSTGGGGGCGLCGGGFTGGLPPSTVTTTIIPTTTIAPTTTISQRGQPNTTTQTTSNQSGTPQSTTITGGKLAPGSGLTPPSLTTILFMAIIALLLVILALILLIGRKKDDEPADPSDYDEDAAAAASAASALAASEAKEKASAKRKRETSAAESARNTRAEAVLTASALVASAADKRASAARRKAAMAEGARNTKAEAALTASALVAAAADRKASANKRNQNKTEDYEKKAEALAIKMAVAGFFDKFRKKKNPAEEQQEKQAVWPQMTGKTETSDNPGTTTFEEVLDQRDTHQEKRTMRQNPPLSQTEAEPKDDVEE